MSFNDRGSSFRGRDSNRGSRDSNRGGFRGGTAAAPGKCTPQYVLTVVLRPRFHSSQLKEDRFTAGTAYQNTENSKFKFSM